MITDPTTKHPKSTTVTMRVIGPPGVMTQLPASTILAEYTSAASPPQL